MSALVVYESMFGNTRDVALAVAAGLGTRMPADAVEVADAPRTIAGDVDLLVIGGPTHAFGLSRPGTRESAAAQAGDRLVSRGGGLREWLDVVSGSGPAAAFDTRVRTPRVPGSAARAAERRLGRLGFEIVAPAETFWVSGTPGPLLDGELGRARAWGERLGGRAAATQPPKRASATTARS